MKLAPLGDSVVGNNNKVGLIRRTFSFTNIENALLCKELLNKILKEATTYAIDRHPKRQLFRMIRKQHTNMLLSKEAFQSSVQISHYLWELPWWDFQLWVQLWVQLWDFQWWEQLWEQLWVQLWDFQLWGFQWWVQLWVQLKAAQLVKMKVLQLLASCWALK
jgi:hypothetical protein